MKSFIIICISAALFLSCGICRKFSSEEKGAKKEDTKTETTKTEKESSEEVKKQSTSDGGNTKASVEMLVFNKSDLPSEIKYTGSIVTGKRWTDRNGENILILTKTEIKSKKGKQPDFEEYVREGELYGYHYVSTGGSYTLLWKVNDFIKDCDFDLTLEFIPSSLSITDLNENGIAESTFLYKMACRSDVSPSDLKLIMHEGESKYALRGEMLASVDGHTYGGSYKADKSYDDAPDGFLEFAKSQWKEFRTETFR
jgi:hypothetical protein